jgi:hypothetical protein
MLTKPEGAIQKEGVPDEKIPDHWSICARAGGVYINACIHSGDKSSKQLHVNRNCLNANATWELPSRRFRDECHLLRRICDGLS